ncbi:mitogen-activated protein kinase kinase kinase 4 isoform X2 [Chironomus tepperi]|uniref:mitogen-activated protein kinase kinase kinase 4 isoform X2 n=1 Tax=Chironomus tepperi TaxID=113505 RepID=UPI00391F61D7
MTQGETISNIKMRTGRLARSRADRRNTLDCAILNQMIIEPSIDEKARTDKRIIQQQREYDREQKMAGNHHQRISQRTSLNCEEYASTNEPAAPSTITTTEPKCIESSSRFMSVRSRPAGSRISAPASAFANLTFPKISPMSPNDGPQKQRRDFHETFSNLIKLGSNDKQEKNTRSVIISKEEQVWQTEVKDLIWLELQANMADRTLEQQDKYLFTARQNVGELLREIMHYRFLRKYNRTDSGISSLASTNESIINSSTGFCFGCLSMYCKDCLDAQSSALRQVESLLSRLEAAENLFPSNKAFGSHFPLYKSEEFVNRVKCMCLWYNMTRHHRLKLIILGKLLAKLQGKEYKWPLVESDSSSGASSVQETEFDGLDSSRGTSDSTKIIDKITTKVLFSVDENDPASTTDSANSEEENKNGDSGYYHPINEYGRMLSSFSNPWKGSIEDVHKKFPSSPYRKFIENVLKSRGLGKSLVFLHRLHNVVLRKAHITLEKPGTEDQEDMFDDEDIPNIEPRMEEEEAAELRRYGVWSEEFKQLALPPYISAFLFLSLIPLEVVQEFLKMKLETKPVHPNPLSLEQLIKELKEGITLALIHRDRFHKHITSALIDRDSDLDIYMRIIDEFDVSLKKIFELYLEYVTQWILTGVPESHRKSALETEWRFTKLVCPMIHDEHSVAAKKFCSIIECLLDEIGNRLTMKADELEKMSFEESTKGVKKDEIMMNGNGNTNCIDGEEEDDPSTIFKNKLLAMCREIQQLFTDEREKCMKLMLFTKSFLKDIEKDDFHREHNCPSDSSVCLRHSTSMCTEVLEAINGLKSKTLELREKLTITLQRVQHRSDVKHLFDMDEIDRQTVLTRCKEILHVGYKFGFEYHKDLSKLFDTVSSPTRNSKVELGLAKAIVGFAKCWMNFVMERCERGRGLRPRWAATGLDFLIIACDPNNTEQIDDKDFDELKSSMDRCISHVIGSIHEPERVRKSPRSRKSSPAPTRKRTPTRSSISYTPTAQKILQQQMSLQIEKSRLSPSPDPDTMRKQTSYENVTEISIKVPAGINSTPELRQVRIRDAVNRLDLNIEKNLRDKNLIGYVKELNACDKVVIRARSVNFSWHRGIKIGQGRFGKVYTAVNNSTGELMAMKEIPIQAGETGTIKRVAEELKIFEGISHKHLVKYYGVEIHREDLLIFMELCAEGSLESLCEISGGLHEALTRRYTTQLLLAVEELHKNGICHRDIKCANIFLTNEGHCLKLGDFGSAIKIQHQATMPGELKGYVGTQSYMAPEVFTKNNTEGHGRAADIWSVGCCVIEMASGKRPWSQFESNFQIMFKVGMGELPEIPSTLSEEGIDFVECCLIHDPKDRWTASELLQHSNFCKISLDCTCEDDKANKNSK